MGMGRLGMDMVYVHVGGVHTERDRGWERARFGARQWRRESERQSKVRCRASGAERARDRARFGACLLYTSPSPRDAHES
eukprot:3926172-Prymnesium_polylepis.1